jgi:hypothetical protein
MIGTAKSECPFTQEGGSSGSVTNVDCTARGLESALYDKFAPLNAWRRDTPSRRRLASRLRLDAKRPNKTPNRGPNPISSHSTTNQSLTKRGFDIAPSQYHTLNNCHPTLTG